jgi:hypothetical protein
MADGDLVPIDNIRTKEERAYRAYQMRLGGEAWPDIASSLNYTSPVTAKREVDLLITKAMNVATDDRKREVVEMELDRLDALQNAVWGMALTGDFKAVETTLKIMQHRARLLALGEESSGNSVQTVIVAGEDYVQTLRGMAK